MPNNDLEQIKERIYDEGTIKTLLEELGCTDIAPPKRQPSGDYLVTARAPNSSNKRGVQVYLTSALRVEIVNEGISTDIYGLVGFILYEFRTFDEVKSQLYQLKTYICSALDYDDLINKKYTPEKPKVDWNYWLRPIQEARVRELDISENELLDEIILREFVPYPWQNWCLEDGISWQTQHFFEIGFHVLTERVTIPVRNKDGKLIGVKGRYVGNDKEQLENKKYNYIYSCAKSIELFNLFNALPYILEAKEVRVVEAAKTTIKLWDWKIKNAVSIEGDRLSPIQAKLLKELGLDVSIIFHLDKDKDEDFVKKQLKQIKNRKVYYTIDNEDRFAEKESPADRTLEDYLELYNNKRLLS